jgi:lysophospholipase L1-like esterase
MLSFIKHYFLKNKINLFNIILAILLIVYLLWEIYWFSNVGYKFIKWHSRIMFWVYIFISLYLFFKIILKNHKKIFLYVALIFIGIILTESILIVWGKLKTDVEKNHGIFKEKFNATNSNKYYWLDEKNALKTLKTSEYSFERNINEYGFSDTDWDLEKIKSSINILSLGDSFTEGDGAHFDSSYVSFLKRNLNQKFENQINILNGGKCGSDPYFNFVVYRDMLLEFNPTLIIQTLSSHDLSHDIALRGGIERFLENGKVKCRSDENKYLEFVYAISYTSRIFFKLFGYNQSLQNPSKYKKYSKQDDKEIIELFRKYSKLVEENKGKFLLVILPTKSESLEKCYSNKFNKLINKLMSIESLILFDLLTCYNSHFINSNKNIQDYYWFDDGHHNAKGYELMAKCIENEIMQRNLIQINQ